MVEIARKRNRRTEETQMLYLLGSSMHDRYNGRANAPARKSDTAKLASKKFFFDCRSLLRKYKVSTILLQRTIAIDKMIETARNCGEYGSWFSEGLL